MGLHVKWTESIVGQIRWKSGEFKYGDKYEWSCIIVPCGDLAILELTTDIPLIKELRKDLGDELYKYGFKKFGWYRSKKGKFIWKEFKIRQYEK